MGDADFDIVVVGSGMNSLVCAAMTARAGHRVAVVERSDRLGGCIRSDELFEGYTHDLMSSWYPLFVTGPAYAELADDLAARGLRFANTATPTGVSMSDGRALTLTTAANDNVNQLDLLGDGDGQRFGTALDDVMTENAQLIFGLLGGEPRSRAVARQLVRELRRRRLTGTIEFLGDSLESCRSWLERDIRSDVTQALIAPWVLHAGLGPDDTASGVMGRLIMATVAAAGMPVVVGGSSGIVDAFTTMITDHGGSVFADSDVGQVVVESGCARGVRLTNGQTLTARRAVVCNVTPQQLYTELLSETTLPAGTLDRARSYRFGRADMQIHYALDAPPSWTCSELDGVAVVHLTAGLDGVSRAVNEATCGLLPAEATVVVGQPSVIDPTRAPDGCSVLWVQLQELPRRVRGDARGEIDAPDDGRWNAALAERYADRIEGRLRASIANFDSAVVGRKVVSPSELESMNRNLVGGDPYSGSCTVDQFVYWRPLPGTKGHGTPIKDLYHIGASTHPGPGLGGTSGYLVAKTLT